MTNKSVAKEIFGSYLKTKRLAGGYSQADVAHKLKLKSAQSISDWERGHGSPIPIPSLLKLIKLYDMNADVIYKLLMDYQMEILENNIRTEFYKKRKSGGRA